MSKRMVYFCESCEAPLEVINGSSMGFIMENEEIEVDLNALAKQVKEAEDVRQAAWELKEETHKAYGIAVTRLNALSRQFKEACINVTNINVY